MVELSEGYPHTRGLVSALIDGVPSTAIEGEFLVDLGSAIGLAGTLGGGAFRATGITLNYRDRTIYLD